MMHRTKRFLLVVLTFAVLPASVVFSEDGPSVKEGYRRPTVTVPYARRKPEIDGVVDDAEWQQAASVRALQTTRHEISVRQARFWMMWDEDHLYMAMRSPLRPGERLIQALRRRDRDINVVFDDSYEIWLDVGAKDPKTGLDCFFQFLCNFANARFDTMHLPSVGNARMGWETGWEPKNRITHNGNAWEWELAIPRESIHVDEPFSDGFDFTCLVARNFKRPWEQNSFEGTGSFTARDTHSRFVLSKSAPALHLLRVGDPKKDVIGIDLAAYGQQDGKVKWRFASDSGKVKEGVLEVKKGALTRIPADLDIDMAGKGHFRVRVTSVDGKTEYLDWCALRKFGHRKNFPDKLADRGDVVKLRPQFNPVHDYVRVTGDFINFDARDQIKNVRIVLTDAKGRKLGQQDLKIDKLAYVEGVVQLEDVPHGKYKTTLTCYGHDGEEMLTRESEFEKKDHAKSFDWWNTPHGNIERVIAPWTPVTWTDDTFGIWGRRMTVGAAGLPAQVTTQNRPLLSRGASLVAALPGGKTVRATAQGAPLVLQKADHRTTVRTQAKLADMDVQSDVMVEFDGMYKVTMTLTPQKPTRVDSLRLVVPFAGEAAEYVHAAGEGIRTGFYYGFLPRTREGELWNSRAVDSQPMKVGSFIPYVWIGSTKGGMCWFADSDEGWVPSDKTPAIQVSRVGERGDVNFVLNLISEPFTIEKPRKIVFAFQASPVKRMHDKWRMDSWWCGDTFYDFAQSGSTIWLAIPYCRNIPKCREMVEKRHKSANSYIFGIDKYRANAVPYFIHQTLPPHLVPEVKYFGDHWRTAVSECLYYGKTLTDYMVHNYAEWCKATGIDGYYVDNMRPVVCDNIEAERGYRLPDGRIQPTYQMFSTRRYFLRVRAAFAEQGKHNKIVLHMTNNMIIPWVGAADIAYDGEHHVIYPEMEKDFMDKWSLERLRVDFPGQWGCAVNFMHEYQGQWEPERMARVMRAYTGAVILHDALPSGNANGWNQAVWIGRDRFGIEADDVRFIGYWDRDGGVETDARDVKIAAWLRPRKLLLAVVNFGERNTAKVKIDWRRLGLPDPSEWKVHDAEAGCTVNRHDRKLRKRVTVWSADAQDPVTHDEKGTISVPVNRHDYRQVIIEPGGAD